MYLMNTITTTYDVTIYLITCTFIVTPGLVPPKALLALHLNI